MTEEDDCLSPALDWFQFYPTKWSSDEGLRFCSYAGRGLWMDTLAIMHRGDPRGYLRVAGRVLTVADLPTFTGRPHAETKKAWAELVANNVPSVEPETGCIYSRRMVRDEIRRIRGTITGRLGGNPALTTGRSLDNLTVDHWVNGEVNEEGNLTHARVRALVSCLSSLPVSAGKTHHPTGDHGLRVEHGALHEDDFPAVLRAYPRFVEGWREWEQIRREKRDPLRPKSAELSLRSCLEWGPERACAAVWHTARRGWIGMREPAEGDWPSEAKPTAAPARSAATGINPGTKHPSEPDRVWDGRGYVSRERWEAATEVWVSRDHSIPKAEWEAQCKPS